jgi:hypothetical protein
MKSRLAILIVIFTIKSLSGLAQSVVEDFKPSSVTQPGKQYPQVNSEGRVRVSIVAPAAQKVQLDVYMSLLCYYLSNKCLC